MSHFIVIFDRRRRHAPAVERYDDADTAQARLFEAEGQLHDDPDRGVVMLYGESEESLRETHASYFLDIDELLDGVASA